MATKTWKNAADGIWTVGSNWSDGASPAAGDTVIFATSGKYTATMPKGSYSLGTLTVGARNTTVSLNGSNLTVGSLTFTGGILKNGSLSGASLTAGAASGGIAVLDAMTISGTLNVGTGTGAVLTIQNGLNLAGGGAIRFMGAAPSQLAADSTQTINGGAIIVDAGARTSIQTEVGAGALALNGTTLEVQGALTVNGATLNGAAHVGSGGSLQFGRSNAAFSSFGANGRVTLDAGSSLLIIQDITTEALVDFASKITRGAGAKAEVSGTITNKGRVLDLSAGSQVASSFNDPGSILVGGTVVNDGAAASLNFGSLYGVTLRGLFQATNPDITTVNVRDSLTVLNTDGSAGTLNLANAGRKLIVESVNGSTAGTFSLGNMTLVASTIDVAVATVLETSFNGIFALSGGIHGTILNKGTVTAAQGVYFDVGGKSGGFAAGSVGSFQNQGTISIAAGGNFAAAAGFANSGVVRLADNAVAAFDGVAVGAVSVEGRGVNISFTAKGATGSLVGLNSDDKLFFKVGGATNATATVSGRTLTVTEDGAAFATFDLGQDGWNTAELSTVLFGGSFIVSNTHGSTAVAPVNVNDPKQIPVVTVPTVPTVPKLDTGGTMTTNGFNLHDRPVAADTSSAAYAADSRPDLTFMNGSTSVGGLTKFDSPASGGPDYIKWAYIMSGSDSMAFATGARDVFIHSGGGNDAIAVQSGNNILDGGTGSNYLTGGTGNDVFFTDLRVADVTWSTLINFHQGDQATIWGFKEGVSTMKWSYYDATGKDGVSGASLDINVAGGAGRNGSGLDARVTFAGMSVSQAASMLRSTGNIDGGEGAYLHFYNQGV